MAFEKFEPTSSEDVQKFINEFSERLALHLAEKSGLAIGRYWMMELPDEIDLDFSSMSMNSPLKFVGYATGTSILILSLTVAVSGGTAELGDHVKFKLPPIAKSIRDMREAFGANPPTKKLPSEKLKTPKKRPPPNNSSSDNCD